MSSGPTKDDLIGQIAGLVMRWQDATQKYDEAVGALYNLNVAERHCLSLLWQAPQTGAAIAREIGLTPPSVTALVDRLELRGYVRREPNPTDRRKIMIAITDKTRAMTERVYQPLAVAGHKLLSGYTREQLLTILDFTQAALEIQHGMIEALPDHAE
jgi:DNA-binding MarR family transcriptional regulator